MLVACIWSTVEASLAQSSKRHPSTTEVMGSTPVSNIWLHVGRVRQHSAESWGVFLRVLPFPPTGKVDRVG